MNRNTKRDERGIVSIMVTMIMMLVISLIVIGFAQVARRNQREALDRQLNTTAYYAAETGVNDAVSYLRAHPNLTTANTGCTDFAGFTAAQSAISTSPAVSYTCLMVNPAPTELVKAPLAQESNLVWPLNGTTDYNTLNIKWSAAPSASPTCSPRPVASMPAYASWSCAFGVMRVDLFDASGSNTDSTDLNLNSRSFYFKPTGVSAAGSVASATFATPNQATLTGVTCSSTNNICEANISGVAGRSYYIRMTMLYKDTAAVRLAAVSASGARVPLTGAEAVVDSTGKAQDELRRIQVRVPLSGSSNFPTNALGTTNDICKLLSVSTLSYSSSCP